MSEKLSDPIESLRIPRHLADEDLYIILDSRRPRPSHDTFHDWVIISGFIEREVDKNGARRNKVVHAVMKQKELLNLGILLHREGWTIHACSGDKYYPLNAVITEGYKKETRIGVVNERTRLLSQETAVRMYGPDDFISVTSTITSVCVGCGHEILSGERILWSPDYRTQARRRGESFHTTCEPGPIEGRAERWEKEAKRRAIQGVNEAHGQ